MFKSNNKLISFIIYIFLLIPFFRITYLVVMYPQTELVYKIWQIISILIIFVILMKYGKYSKFLNYFIVYFILLMLSTVLNNADVPGCIFLAIRTIGLCMIVDYGIKRDAKVFLNAFEFFLSVLVYINLFSVIIFKDGMYINSTVGYTENWILGYRNLHILYILPAILASFINSYYKEGKLTIRNYILLIASYLSIYLVKSGTSLIGMTIIVGLLILNNIFKKIKLLNIKNYFLAYIILFLAIVIFRIQNLFEYIIVDILNRDLTLTGRIYIWDYVIEFIKERPILGYGVEDSILRLNKTSFMVSTHAHDQILEIIYKSGIVGSSIYFIILIKSIIELYKYKESKIAQILSIVMFAYLFMMLTEFFSLDLIMFLFVFCLDIKFFAKEGENNETIN